MSFLERSRPLFGLLLVLAYVLPLFAPPAPVVPGETAAAAGLFGRIFNSVPSGWVVARLLCLAAGAVMLALSLPPLRGHRAPRGDGPGAPAPSARSAWAALSVAALLALVSLFSAHFGQVGGSLYFVSLVLPASLLAIPRLVLARRSASALGVVILPAVWLMWSAPLAWRSPRAANVLDGWLAVQRLDEVAAGALNPLLYNFGVGLTNAYMVLQGLPLLGLQSPDRTFVLLQGANLLWTACAAVLIGLLARRCVAVRAAFVAQTALLFSPFVYSFPYDPLPVFLGPLCISVLLLAFFAVREHGSCAALALFGAVAGFTVRNPLLAPSALLLSGMLAHVVVRRVRLPRIAVATALLVAAAAALPGLPSIAMIAGTADRFATSSAQFSGMLMILFGQQSPALVMDVLQSGRAGVLEVPLATLLAPFAIVREPLRLWGDVLYEPFSTVLASVGLLLSLRFARRERDAALWIAILALGLLPGMVSSGDQVSHTRLAGTTVPMAILAAKGFEALRLRFAGRDAAWPATVLVCALMALSGLTLFHVVNPRLLPASSLATSFEALAGGGPGDGVVFLEHGGPRNFTWLHTRRIAAQLPARPLPTLTEREFQERALARAEAPPGLYFWSPGFAQDWKPWDAICARWPRAALYTLWDRPHLFHAFAAAPQGDVWKPALPAERWQVGFCGG